MIKIKVIKVELENKGKYKALKVTYEDMDKNKASSKTLVDFANKAVFNLMQHAVDGDIFDIELVKDDAGFWQWASAKKSDGATDSPAASTKSAGTSTGFTSTPRNTYETPEERAKKQVYIVRQSSLTAALTFKSVWEAKKPAQTTVEDIIEVAKQFEAYVFGQDPISQLKAMNDPLPEEPNVE